jgi:hypothetical protein
VTLGLAALLVGSMLLYAAIKGLSFTRLLVGDNQTQATAGSVG